MPSFRSTLAALTAIAAISAPAWAGETKKSAPKKEAPAKAEAPALSDIPSVAASAGSFTTLLAAVKAAGLEETLKGAGPFTVFAPTDEAFAKIPKKDLDALLKDKEKLKAILLAHVVSGKVLAADVAAKKDGDKVATAGGKEIVLGLKGGVTFGGAKVVKTDIAASNGVIHVIDTVVIPK